MPVLETARPLSQSSLWRFQRDYFTSNSIKAWGSGPVPFHVTSNTLIARDYAAMVLGYLRDLAAAGQLDWERPFYIVELGAGSGRFSFLLRPHLDEMLGASPFAGLRTVLVMTDFIESNLEHWWQRPELAGWFKQGSLDLALFDVEADRGLALMIGDENLEPGQAKNPMVFIANYVFDSIPQDVFRITGGRIEEYLAVMEEDPAEGFTLSFQRRAVSADHYESDELNGLLATYQGSGTGTLAIPVSALDCIGRLRAISGGRMLLLAGDKGYGPGSLQRDAVAPTVARHGSCSMMVNFDAIGRWVRARGGVDFHPAEAPVSLYVAAFALGLGDAGETRLAYRQNVDHGGPDEVFALTMAASQIQGASLDQLIGFLRLADYDSVMFASLLPALRPLLDDAAPRQIEALRQALALVDENYFPIGESYDLAFDLGVMLLRIGDYEAAALQLDKSYRRFGADASTLINLAQCMHRLHRLNDAIALLNQAWLLDPENEMGKQVRRCVDWALLAETRSLAAE